MCITFVFVNPDPKPGTFRLILAMNRDEGFGRPSAGAEFQDDILCGRDLTPGKEGGTWLAIDRQGRIGVLTNISTGKAETEGKGRGHLIIDFLKQKISAKEYLSKLSQDQSTFNPFNLCLFDIRTPEEGYKTFYYCRGKPGHVIQSLEPAEIDLGYLGLSNHPLDKPFNKTSYGLNKFKNAVEELNDVNKVEEMLQALQKLMNDDHQHLPDEQMSLQIAPRPVPPPISSIFVASENYGTRAQTFILVDHSYKVHFVERARSHQDQQAWNQTRQEYDCKLTQ